MDATTTALTTPTLADFTLADWFIGLPEAEQAGLLDGAEDFESWQAAMQTKAETTYAAAAAAAASSSSSAAPVAAALAASTAAPEADDADADMDSGLRTPEPRGKRAKAYSNASSSASQGSRAAADPKNKKQQQNKAAADRYRRKKRAQFELLQQQSSVLVDENTALKRKCEKLESEVSYLKELLLATVRQAVSLPKVAASLKDTSAAAANRLNLPTKSHPAAVAAMDGEQALQSALRHLAAEHTSATEARLAALEQQFAGLEERRA